MVSEEDRVDHEPWNWQLWFGLLGGPVAWSVHFLLVYGLSEGLCASGGTAATLFGFPLLNGSVLLATIIAALVALGCLVLARRTSSEQRSTGPEYERTDYMSKIGILSSGLFLFVILFEGLIVLVSPPCF
jgi:hypothetical protein